MLRDDTLAAVALLSRGADRAVRWRLSLAALLAVAGGARAALAPLALKDLIDTLTARPASGIGTWTSLWGIAPSDLASVGALAAAYLCCQCAVRMLAEARPVLMNAAEQTLYADLRSRYLQQLLSLPLQFHLDRRAGALLQEFQQAATGYQVILFHLVNSVVPIVVEACAVMLILMSLRQPALTGVVALTALAYLLVTGWRSDALRTAAAAVTAASAEVQAQLAEGLLHVEPIKVFGAERRTVAGVRQASDTLHDAWTQLQRERMQRGVALIAVFGGAMAAALFLSLSAVLDGSLTVGGFVLSTLYLLQVVRPLEALSGAVRDVHQALAFVKPLMTIMAMPSAPVASAILAGPGETATAPTAPTAPTDSSDSSDSSDAGDTSDTKDTAAPSILGDANTAGQTPLPATVSLAGPRAPEVLFRGIGLAFDDRLPVLRDLQLRIPAGRTTAIVGASGCGKSSLVRLLLRLQEPQRGSILVGGTSITEMPIHSLRAMVAVVPQDVLLLHASVAANIGFGKEDATQPEIERAAQLAGLHELIACLPTGYSTVIGERGLKLSGGERQRIAIARAVLRDPLIYVLDEATSMLDAATEASLMQRFRNIASARTTILIAHRLSTVRHADQIAVLEDGRVVEIGVHAALIELGGRYAALWRAQEAARLFERPV